MARKAKKPGKGRSSSGESSDGDDDGYWRQQFYDDDDDGETDFTDGWYPRRPKEEPALRARSSGEGPSSLMSPSEIINLHPHVVTIMVEAGRKKGSAVETMELDSTQLCLLSRDPYCPPELLHFFRD